MANNPEEKRNRNAKEPKGLGEHARGPASEAAHEQGWDINEEERSEQPKGRPAHYGGKGFDYGANDFGDTAAKRDNPSGVEDEADDQQRKAS